MDLLCEEEMLPEEDSPGCGGTVTEAGSVTEPRLAQGPILNLRPEEMPLATLQPNLLNDPRVLTNMLQSEEMNMPSVNYFKTIQVDITPEMRRGVASWMHEVSPYPVSSTRLSSPFCAIDNKVPLWSSTIATAQSLGPIVPRGARAQAKFSELFFILTKFFLTYAIIHAILRLT